MQPLPANPHKPKWMSHAGYDTLYPKKVISLISSSLKDYSKTNKAFKLNSRKYHSDEVETRWKIFHDGKHFGEIKLQTDDLGCAFGYGIPPEIAQLKDKKKRDWYGALLGMVVSHVKSRIDVRFAVGEWWETRRPGLPKSLDKRKEYRHVYDLIKKKEDKYTGEHARGDSESASVFDSEMISHLKKHEVTYGIRTLKKIRKLGNAGHLDHVKDYEPFT
jgi:hypothetical protein